MITSLDLTTIDSNKIKINGEYRSHSSTPSVYFGGVEFDSEEQPGYVTLEVNVDFREISTKSPGFADFFRVTLQEKVSRF